MDKAVLFCSRDGFPIITVNGKEHCSAEYLDRCIGSKRIVDVELREGALYYIFENEHELPLYCFCCDEPLACKDFPKYKQAIVGRKLEAMVWDIEKYEDGREALDFGLELSMLEGEDEPLIISTSLLSAQMMAHPKHCGYHRHEQSSLETRKKERKPRSRGRRGRKSSKANK